MYNIHVFCLKLKEIAELKEQLQDLMRHLSIQSAVASSSEDTRKVCIILPNVYSL